MSEITPFFRALPTVTQCFSHISEKDGFSIAAVQQTLSHKNIITDPIPPRIFPFSTFQFETNSSSNSLFSVSPFCCVLNAGPPLTSFWLPVSLHLLTFSWLWIQSVWGWNVDTEICPVLFNTTVTILKNSLWKRTALYISSTKQTGSCSSWEQGECRSSPPTSSPHRAVLVCGLSHSLPV